MANTKTLIDQAYSAFNQAFSAFVTIFFAFL
jgi:hypothetical protein